MSVDCTHQEKGMKSLSWHLFGWSAALLGSICLARARGDLVIAGAASTAVPRFGTGLFIERYSDAGTDLGHFGSVMLAETVPTIAAGPDGNVYALGNNVGSMRLYRFAGDTGATLAVNDTSSFLQGSDNIGFGFGPAGSYLLAPSYPPGVLKIGSTSGNLLGTAITFPDSGGFSSVTFNPVSNELYCVQSTKLLEYTYNPIGGAYTQNTGFNLSVAININGASPLRTAPGNSNVFVSTGTEIDQYDPAGNFVNTFVPAASGGLQKVEDYTFGSDGILYVLSGVSSGGYQYSNEALLLYDANTGAFIDQRIISTPSHQNGHLAMAYLAGPEPASAGILMIGAVLLVRRRR
jgi:hypothetical protein